ncbi:cobalamin biosynthesis protein [Nocardioides sp.]|uniref:cobalamin biosynthesis protein n=1 Tax=Nocardioides sp. TaxID=35761 RepID=UPI00286D55E5|nr:cobalamin biosynthesis protein [Nocardioides sp.]
MSSRAAGLLLGLAADRALGDPVRWHPVAGFGRLAGALEQVTYDDARGAGVRHTALLVGGTVALGVAAERATRDRPLLHTLVTAAATWTVLGGTSLGREATAVHDLLASGDLPGARQRLTHLVGRDTSALDPAGVARAVVESVAENTSDAVVAPLVLGAVAGLPGLLGYRAANTLDAMVGHRTPRLERFGWASARLDDALNLPGARLAGALTVLLGEDRRGGVRAWRRDAAAHPSPNAGVVEAAFAGSLGLRLGGLTTYASGAEQRPALGDGRDPGPGDIVRATRLATRVQVGAGVVSAGLALSGGRRPRRPPQPRR